MPTRRSSATREDYRQEGVKIQEKGEVFSYQKRGKKIYLARTTAGHIQSSKLLSSRGSDKNLKDNG